MRFVFVDRIVREEAGQAIEVVKNVAATEDVFDDHFPGCPILPGALIIEVFEQAAQLLIGKSSAFRRVGRLEEVSRATFRHVVRPGDQIVATCERTGGDDTAWTVEATASVDGRRVATATLAFTVHESDAGAETREQAARLRDLDAVLHDTRVGASLLGAAP